MVQGNQGKFCNIVSKVSIDFHNFKVYIFRMSIVHKFNPDLLTLVDHIQSQIENFLGIMQSKGYVDGHVLESQTRTKLDVRTFKIRGAHSEERYELAGLLRGTWRSEAELKEGVLKPRSKLDDYYMRVTLDREKQSVNVSFTTIGYQQHVKRIGVVDPVEVQGISDNNIYSFFDDVSHVMQELVPALEAKRDCAQRKLDRLTTPEITAP